MSLYLRLLISVSIFLSSREYFMRVACLAMSYAFVVKASLESITNPGVPYLA